MVGTEYTAERENTVERERMAEREGTIKNTIECDTRSKCWYAGNYMRDLI